MKTNNFSLKNEEWRPVPNNENRYLISNFGRITNIKTNSILAHSHTPNGRHIINLAIDGVNQTIKRGKISIRQKIKCFDVGYLVARAFKSELRRSEQYVRFSDGNYDNLRPENLIWSETRESRKD